MALEVEGPNASMDNYWKLIDLKFIESSETCTLGSTVLCLFKTHFNSIANFTQLSCFIIYIYIYIYIYNII